MWSHVAVKGNVYFPQWPRHSRLPDGFEAPSDSMFIAAMFVGVVLYLALAIVVLSVGMVWYTLGHCAKALRVETLRAAAVGRNRIS
jgi:hypothetical protein